MAAKDLITLDELEKILPQYEQTAEQALIRRFGKGKVEINQSSYILKDGTIINSGYEAHPEAQCVLLKALPNNIQLMTGIIGIPWEDCDESTWDKAMNLIASAPEFATGAIRTNSAENNTYILISYQPTIAQYDILTAWLDKILYLNGAVEVATDFQSIPNMALKTYNMATDDVDSIIKEIKRYCARAPKHGAK